MTGLVGDGVVVVHEEVLPSELAAVEDAGSGEVLEVFMVGDDFDQAGCSFQPMSPML